MLSVFITSCCELEGEFTHTGISLESLDFNSGEPEVIGTSSVSNSSFGLRIELHYHNNLAFAYPPLPSSLFATSCAEKYSFIEEVIDIEIRSTGDLDFNHPAGALLNDLFIGWSWNDKESSISDLVDDLNDPRMMNVRRYLQLQDTEIEDSAHQFILSLILSDSRSISDTTRTIHFED